MSRFQQILPQGELQSQVQPVGSPETRDSKSLTGGKKIKGRQATSVSLRFNSQRNSVKLGGNVVPLTAMEFKMLQYLSKCRGHTVTKEMFLDELYEGEARPAAKIIDVFVCKIRGKMRAAGVDGNVIETVWGRGYRIERRGRSRRRNL